MTAGIVPHGYYVYTHHRATTGEIFYVGMGHERRAWKKGARSKYWKAIETKHGRTVTIVESGLQRWAAAELEQNLIALHGRKDLGLGPLINFSEGGEGGSFGWKASKETRTKMSAAAKGVPKTTRRAVMCSNGMTFESTKAAGAWAKTQGFGDYAQGNINSCCNGKQFIAYGLQWWWKDQQAPSKSAEEIKAERKQQALKPVVCMETGVRYGSQTDAAKICKINRRCICKVLSGERRRAGGYTWRYFDPAHPL